MDTKNVLTSKAVWGGVVSVLGGVGALAGLDFSAPVQTELTEIMVGLASLIGGVVAIWGRIVAVTQLVWSKK